MNNQIEGTLLRILNKGCHVADVKTNEAEVQIWSSNKNLDACKGMIEELRQIQPNSNVRFSFITAGNENKFWLTTKSEVKVVNSASKRDLKLADKQ